jgi:hypothetical protein
VSFAELGKRATAVKARRSCTFAQCLVEVMVGKDVTVGGDGVDGRREGERSSEGRTSRWNLARRDPRAVV